jgi:hypothetical protein
MHHARPSPAATSQPPQTALQRHDPSRIVRSSDDDTGIIAPVRRFDASARKQQYLFPSNKF